MAFLKIRNEGFEKFASKFISNNFEYLTSSNKTDILFFIRQFKDSPLSSLKTKIKEGLKKDIKI